MKSVRNLMIAASVLSCLVSLAGPAQADQSPQLIAQLRVLRPAAPEGAAGYERYRRTMAELLKSPWVINATLRDPSVSQLDIVKENEDPRQWLMKSLDVKLPEGTGLIQLRMAAAGGKQEQTAKLLNKLIDTFVDEVVSKERLEKVTQLEKWRVRYRRSFEEIREKSDQIQILAERLGTAESGVDKLELEIKMDELRQRRREQHRLRRRIVDLHFSTIAAQVRAKTDKKAATELEILKAQTTFATEGLERLRLETDELLSEIKQYSGRSGDLDARKDELTLLRNVRRELSEEILKLELELEQPARVQIVHPARVVAPPR